jgi:hypothetical protein
MVVGVYGRKGCSLHGGQEGASEGGSGDQL